MTTPDPHADFASVCEQVCPGFRADGPPQHARKSEHLTGTLDGQPVFAKRLLRPNLVWAWYLNREIALYRELDRHPIAGVRVPRFITAGRGVLVIERLRGSPLAKRRRPYVSMSHAEVARIVAMRAALAGWSGTAPAAPSTGVLRSQLRKRLLEDPTAPVEWIRHGIELSAPRGGVTEEQAARLDDAIAAHCPVAFGHGDMLLRNFVGDGLVDWECAGPHIHDWDLALLWTQLAVPSRAHVEAMIEPGPRTQAFRALCAFALLREIRFEQAFSAGRPDQLAAIRAELEPLLT